MKTHNQALKTKKIYVYKEIEELSENSDIIRYKKYLNKSKEDFYWAYIRQVSAKEMGLDKSSNYNEEIEVVMNYKSNLEIGMLIEYDGKVYRINSIDNLFFLRTEIKLRALAIKPDEYIKVEWSKC